MRNAHHDWPVATFKGERVGKREHVPAGPAVVWDGKHSKPLPAVVSSLMLRQCISRHEATWKSHGTLSSSS